MNTTSDDTAGTSSSLCHKNLQTEPTTSLFTGNKCSTTTATRTTRSLPAARPRHSMSHRGRRRGQQQTGSRRRHRRVGGRSGSRQGSPRRRLRRDVPPALGRQSPPLVLLPLLYGPLYPVPFLPFFSRLLLPLLKLKLDRLFGQQSRIMEEGGEERGRVEGGSRN